MPKKLSLQSHLSTAELKAAYRSNADPVESRRLHLIWLLSRDYSLVEGAKAVGLNYDYAYEIVKRYNQQGIEGLKNGRKKSRPPRSDALLNAEQQEKLAERLKTKPDDGGVWSGPKVARWIEQETGQEHVWNQRGWEYLKKVGYSWQRPRPRHEKADMEAQETFKKTPNPKSQNRNGLSGGQGGSVGFR